MYILLLKTKTKLLVIPGLEPNQNTRPTNLKAVKMTLSTQILYKQLIFYIGNFKVE